MARKLKLAVTRRRFHLHLHPQVQDPSHPMPTFVAATCAPALTPAMDGPRAVMAQRRELALAACLAHGRYPPAINKTLELDGEKSWSKPACAY